MQRQQRLKQGATDRADYSLWFEKAPDKAETWLAKLRSRTVGQLVLGAGDTQNSGVILDLSLDEAYRGRCFGQQLLGQAVSVLRNCGAREIQVSVPDANARAAHFFAENGFVPQTRAARSFSRTSRFARFRRLHRKTAADENVCRCAFYLPPVMPVPEVVPV